MEILPVTAISFGSSSHSYSEWMLEKTSNYFHLWGQKAYIAPDCLQKGTTRSIFLAERVSSPLEVAIKIISYCSLLIPLIVGMIYIPLRSYHKFNVVQLDSLLAGGLTLDAELQKRLSLIMKSYQGKDDVILDFNLSQEEAQASLMRNLEEQQNIAKQRAKLKFKIISQSYSTIVFSFEDKPELVFKIATKYGNQKLKCRFENKLKGKAICMAHDLDHLTIPKIKRIYLENKMILAEEYLPITQKYNTDRRYEASPALIKTEAIRQLVIFIAHTNWSDVAYRNIPLIDEPSSENHNNIALIDLEELYDASLQEGGAVTGIYGSLYREGLMSCLHAPEHIFTAVLTSLWFGIIPWKQCVNRIRARANSTLYYYRFCN